MLQTEAPHPRAAMEDGPQTAAYFSTSRRSVGVLSTIVQVAAGPMPHAGQDLTLRHAVAAQPIRDDLARLVLQAHQQAFEEAFGGRGIAAVLDQNVEQDTVLVHGAPEIEELAVDLQVHLILSAKSSG